MSGSGKPCQWLENTSSGKIFRMSLWFFYGLLAYMALKWLVSFFVSKIRVFIIFNNSWSTYCCRFGCSQDIHYLFLYIFYSCYPWYTMKTWSSGLVRIYRKIPNRSHAQTEPDRTIFPKVSISLLDLWLYGSYFAVKSGTKRLKHTFFHVAWLNEVPWW